MENNKTRTILTIAVLGVFLAAFTLWTVFKPADAASDAERRSLAQLPALTGQSLLSGLPAISRVLLQIYSAIGKNFERMGNLRYAVTYRPTPGDGTDAAAVANEISRE